jgi:hypothetical protein
MRIFFILVMTFIGLTAGTRASAAEITKDNLVGFYVLEAKVLTKKMLFHLKVVSDTEFHVSSQDGDGNMGQWCNGPFTVTKEWSSEKGSETIIRSEFTCPDNRSKVSTLNLNLKSAQVRDLEKGAQVEITSKEISYTVYGKLKKQAALP